MRQEKPQCIYCQLVPQVPRSLAIPLYFLLSLESSIRVFFFFFDPEFVVVFIAVISGRNKIECVYTALSGTISLQSSTIFFSLLFNSILKIFLGFAQSYHSCFPLW